MRFDIDLKQIILGRMADFILSSPVDGQELKRAAVAITVVARDEDDAFGRPGDAACLGVGSEI